jgi:uncharacterized protein YeaO (DUF488 family)
MMMGERDGYVGPLDEEGQVPDLPQIYLCRVYDLPKQANEIHGKRILVDRVWPRGVKKDALHLDVWLRDVAPSNELRKWFGHDPARWEEFQRRYRDELAAPERQVALRELLDLVRAGTVTLLYGARDEEHNQAAVLKAVVEATLGRSNATQHS